MQIPFNLPHVFNAQSNDVDNARALEALLGCLVNLNIAHLQLHPEPELYKTKVRYGRTKLWEPIPALYSRKLGDCKSLTGARIAELRLKGIRCMPVFRFRPRGDGNKDFHILVMFPTMKEALRAQAYGAVIESNAEIAYFEDPSKKLGMGKNETSKFFVDSFGADSGTWLSKLRRWLLP